MARANTQTLLSLDRWAAIMGINPAHFNGAATATVMAVTSDCESIWTQYAWQRPDVISREELATLIASSESDIARVLGYWPAPMYTVKEHRSYDQFYRATLFGLGGVQPNFRKKTVVLQNGKVIAAGARAVALGAAGVTVTYTDEDGDSIDDTATITTTIAAGSDAGLVIAADWYNGFPFQDFGLYYAGKGGDPVWKIRDPRSWSVTSNGDGSYAMTVTFWPWQLIEESLVEQLPNPHDGYVRAVDYSNADNTIDTVDIYLEYPDITATCVDFYWDSFDGVTLDLSANTTATGMVIQSGTFQIRDADMSVVTPVPATWDSDNGVWVDNGFAVRRDPDFVHVSYLSGLRSSNYHALRTPDPLAHEIAEAIAFLTAARLTRPVCSCGNAADLVERLQSDVAVYSPQGNFTITADEVLNNPFGTREGEVRAWRRIARLAPRVLDGGSL